jgi:hypothetical protein
MQGPTPLLIESTIRIYFAARNRDGKSYPAFIDVCGSDPSRVLRVQDAAILQHGAAGTFDDEGIMPACTLHVDGAIWMYYSGWNQRRTIPYHNTTGLAVSADGGTRFSRMFDGPILERTPYEPYMAVTPWVVREPGLWRMWYVSGLCWKNVHGRYEPVYAIKYAESLDGIAWQRPNLLAITQRHPLEACAHPSVVRRSGKYHMWFCYRDTIDFRDGNGSYRIGYAQSLDGKTWSRDDSVAGIDVGETGWDSTMLCYPSVVEANGELLMFYNGNSFGQTGIGCAVWHGALP